MGKAIPGTRAKLVSINREITIANRNRKNLLSKNAVDENTLKEYATNKQALFELGLDISDLSKLANFLTNVKKEGFDPRAVITKFNAIDSLEGRERDLKGIIKKAEDDNTDF